MLLPTLGCNTHFFLSLVSKDSVKWLQKARRKPWTWQELGSKCPVTTLWLGKEVRLLIAIFSQCQSWISSRSSMLPSDPAMHPQSIFFPTLWTINYSYFLSLITMDSSSLILILNPWACFWNCWEICFIQKGTSLGSICAPAFMSSVTSSLCCISGLYSQPVKIVPLVHQIPCPITTQGHWSNSGPFSLPHIMSVGVATLQCSRAACVWKLLYRTAQV